MDVFITAFIVGIIMSAMLFSYRWARRALDRRADGPSA